MYYEHFGLQQAPFKITPDTRLFYEGGKRGDILGALAYAILSGEGIIKVVGEVGSGKTMLSRMLEVKLPEHVDIVYFANPSLAPADVLYAIAVELKIDLASGNDRIQALHALQQTLLQRHAEGRQVVCFVEEAQSMPLETLEEIRLLSNLETHVAKLLQIVLFGQPELDDNLNQQSIRQLRERIVHSFYLDPFGNTDISSYVSFRMRAVGYRGPDVFTKGAYKALEKASLGLIRRVNIIGDKALLAAFAQNSHEVTEQHVRSAIRDSEFGRDPDRKSPYRRLGIAAGVLLALALGWVSGGGLEAHGVPGLAMLLDSAKSGAAAAESVGVSGADVTASTAAVTPAATLPVQRQAGATAAAIGQVVGAQALVETAMPAGTQQLAVARPSAQVVYPVAGAQPAQQLVYQAPASQPSGQVTQQRSAAVGVQPGTALSLPVQTIAQQPVAAQSLPTQPVRSQAGVTQPGLAQPGLTQPRLTQQVLTQPAPAQANMVLSRPIQAVAQMSIAPATPQLGATLPLNAMPAMASAPAQLVAAAPQSNIQQPVVRTRPAVAAPVMQAAAVMPPIQSSAQQTVMSPAASQTTTSAAVPQANLPPSAVVGHGAVSAQPHAVVRAQTQYIPTPLATMAPQTSTQATPKALATSSTQMAWAPKVAAHQPAANSETTNFIATPARNATALRRNSTVENVAIESAPVDRAPARSTAVVDPLVATNETQALILAGVLSVETAAAGTAVTAESADAITRDQPSARRSTAAAAVGGDNRPATPRASTTASPNQVPTNDTTALLAGSLLGDRLRATEAWLLAANGNHFSIQLMLANESTQQNLEVFLERWQQTGHLSSLYVYRTAVRGAVWYGVLYNEYPSLQAAKAALDALPDELKRHRPFIRNIKDIGAISMRLLPTTAQFADRLRSPVLFTARSSFQAWAQLGRKASEIDVSST